MALATNNVNCNGGDNGNEKYDAKGIEKNNGNDTMTTTVDMICVSIQ